MVSRLVDEDTANRTSEEEIGVTNWHFSHSFRLIFLTLTITILQILSYQPHHAHFKSFRLFTMFTDNQKNVCIKPKT